MAFDLAKVDPKSGSIPDPTFRRETTMPRQGTDRPELDVPERITPPRATNNAAQLAKLLGVATDVAADAFGQIQERKDKEDAAAAALDFSRGAKDDPRFAKSIAYRDAWQLQGAKQLAVQIGAEATQKVNDRLNDSDNPATPEDIDQVVEGVFQDHIIGPDGKPRDFGTPEAKMVLVNALNEVRANLLPQALAAIHKQTDGRFLATWGDNVVRDYYRGAPVGAVVKNDPLAPLPDNATIPVPTNGGPVAGHLVEPFAGFSKMKPNSVMGAPRQNGSRHNGEDYPIPTGTPLVSPMAGKVIAAFSNARGGNQVRVQMADGAIIGYAHLSRLDVRVGDQVSAGQAVGLSGATGDATGPHVHMTVEVNGKKVSAKSFFAGQHTGLAEAAPAPGIASVALATSPGQQPVQSELPPFHFEEAMAQLPPSINRGEAKKYLLQELFNVANAKGDIGILAGLEDSRRKDGTPSFNPAEIAQIQQAREAVADRARVDAKRAQQELWQKNGDALTLALVGNNPPSNDFIARAAQSGLIDPSNAYTFIQHNRAIAREAASEARMEDRQADAAADASYDAFTAGEVARMSVGDFSGPSAEDLWKRGKLGAPGKKSIGRYNQLRAAERAGEQRNRENPLYGQYMGQLRMKYGGATTNPFLAPQYRSGTDNQTNYYGMLAFYKLKVSKGMDPEEAYLETVAKFGPTTDASSARRQLIKELQAKKAQ